MPSMRLTARTRTLAALFLAALALAGSLSCRALPEPAPDADTVVLLHGLARSNRSMRPLEKSLRHAGYRVANIDYPTRDLGFDEIVSEISVQVASLDRHPDSRVHFVTHSLGGLVVRSMLADEQPDDLGRVVMLGPPNQGSELADTFERSWWMGWLFALATGEVGGELGTEGGDVPARLGPVDFELGVVAGNGTINPLYSSLIPGDDDGKVAVESTRVEGMSDFVVVPHSHTFMMRSDRVADEVEHFLRYGRFRPEDDAGR